MKKHIILFIFISYLFAQVFDLKKSNRIRNDFTSNENIIAKNSNYRDEEELIQFIENIMNEFSIPGLSISIVKEGAIVWEKYLGYANINENILIDENTLFMLASVSKTITATALMQLFEDGLFSLDDDIDNFLPFSINHPDYLTPITFKMLLTHTSGIKDNWDVMPYYDGDSNLELGYYLEQYLVSGGEFYDSSSNFTNSMPGTNYTYSNIGAALIGLLIEKISGKTFNMYCNENIFEPLSMNDAFWFLSEIENVNQIATPYIPIGGAGYVDDCSSDGDCCPESWIGDGFPDCEDQQWGCDLSCYDNDGGDCGNGSSDPYCGDGFCNGNENYNTCPDDCLNGGCNESSIAEHIHYGYSDYPSGQLRITSNNLAKFMAAFINNGVYNGNRILEFETVEMIKSIPYPEIEPQQGLMWYYKNSGINGRILFGHNGGDIGVTTEMFISASNNIGVIVLSNSNNYNEIIEIENALFNFAETTIFSIIGDVNLDNILNILDVIVIVNIILGINDFNHIADIDNNGNINVIDVIQLIHLILNG